ncbi:energy transducer TonB [Novosphingobium sp. BL-8H]|uniref:energy transducer TonB n=1 Tax=Novosphingobium sp. BL-8H TaxID=3127640 RepID=UPI00375848C1
MTGLASIPQSAPISRPESAALRGMGEVIAMPQAAVATALGTWQASGRYGDARGANLPAVAASLAVVAGMLATILAMNVVDFKKPLRQRIVVADLSAPVPPPPPKQAEPKPVLPPPPSPIVAPPPPVVLTNNPPPIVTSPVPVPVPAVAMVASAPISAPVSAPAAAAPAPRVENAGDLSSKMISAEPPRYPLDSRRKHEQGTVVLALLLDLDGKVADISISKSSGSDRLDHAALSAVRRWRWSPTKRDGAAVMVRGLVEIPFVLQT